MLTYVVRLLDGQTLNVAHAATTIGEFMRYLRKEKFIIARTGDEEIGVSTRSVATVKSERRRAETFECATSDSEDNRVAVIG
jgi:hypothetical protein